MFVAACLDAGVVSVEDLQAVPMMLGLEGVSVVARQVERASIAATHVAVVSGEHGEAVEPGHNPTGSHEHHGHTHYDRLDERLASSELPTKAKSFARLVFRLLAEAEASAHGKEWGKVVFHEVGSVDSIVDVAMAGLCVERIGAGRVTASPVPLGRGFVNIAHGCLAIPAPATAHLAIGVLIAPFPRGIDREDVELTTPTGMAIIRALDPEFLQSWPAGTPVSSGLGAGSMDLGSFANVLRVTVSDGEQSGVHPFDEDLVYEVTCNLDDQTPERSAWVAEQALALGALDVWTVPVLGKKGRPAIQISLLVEASEKERFLAWILEATSTFGVRFRSWRRWKLIKRIEEREGPDGQSVRYALGVTLEGTVLKEKPEYEDIRRYWPPESRP